VKPEGSALTTGSIPRALFTFALPILMGNVLQTVNGSVNSIWVGKYLGTAALTATNNANLVMFLLLGSVFGLTLAATILIAQHVGARNLPEARRTVGTSATFFTAVALLFSLTGLALSSHILTWMGTPEDAMPLAMAYMRVMFLALPASFGFFFIMAALRGAGDSKTPFYFLVLSVALDIVLNPVFIFGVGPIPALGIAGSATATLIAQFVSLGAMVRHIYKRRNPLALHRQDLAFLKPDRAILRSIIFKGIPMGLQMIVLSSSAVLFQRFVNRFGSDTAAAFAAAQQLWNYVQMPALALGGAVSSMAAQNIGAKLWDRVSATARAGVGFNFLMTGVPVLAVYVLSHLALGLFLPAGSPAIAIAEHINLIVLWSFPLFGVSMVLSGVMRAAGDVVIPLLILAVAMLAVRIPLALLTVERWGADALWWSFTISALVSMILSVGYYLSGRWKNARMLGPSAAQSA
jgi:putative MATE family efflux protein